MLAKKYKLPVQLFTAKTGRNYKTRFFLLKVFSPAQLPHSRVGVVVSRKVSVKATKRNHLRRIVFDFFRMNVERLPIRDYLVIVLPSADRATKDELSENLLRMLNLN